MKRAITVDETGPVQAVVQPPGVSTYLHNLVSQEAWALLASQGVLKSRFLTEWEFLAEGGAGMIAGVPKQERYLLGLVPYDLEKLQTELQATEAEIIAHPNEWDHCICVNWEDANAWLAWRAGNDQEREEAIAQFAHVMGRALTALQSVQVGSWGTLKANRGNRNIPPWRRAAARLGSCVHVSGYWLEGAKPPWEWIHAQIEAAIELANGRPEMVRMWVLYRGFDDVPISQKNLIEIGRVAGEAGIGVVVYDDSLYNTKFFNLRPRDPVPPEIQRLFDRQVTQMCGAIQRGMRAADLPELPAPPSTSPKMTDGP